MPQPQAAPLDYLGFRLIPPGSLLRPYVRSYWYFERQTPLLTAHEEFMHPRGGFGVVFNFGDRLHLDGAGINAPVFLDGTTTISRRMGFLGSIELLGISFWAGGAYPFLGVPLTELRNETALLDALDRGTLLRLHEQLYEAESLPARVQLLDDWLLRRLAQGKTRLPLIPASLALLANTSERRSIPEVAQQLGISQRQLERLYHEQVGMAPKQYARLLRVETARLALKQTPGQPQTRLAVDLDFYDQSHFIREFRAVVGMTPQQYVQRHQQRTQSAR